jgi:hypothetical protein
MAEVLYRALLEARGKKIMEPDVSAGLLDW